MPEPMPEPTAQPLADPSTYAHAGTRAASSSSSSSTPTPTIPTNVAVIRGWDGQIDVDSVSAELRRRQVNAGLRDLLVNASLEAIARTICWWDEQQSDSPSPGVGVLVGMIKRGGIKDQSHRASIVEHNRLYGEGICDWLNDHFPELTQPSGRPHPAAFVAVTHLHQQHGKGSLTRAKHGSEIHRRVREWDARYPIQEAA